MFTRIRNGQLRLLSKVEMPSSNFRLKILEVLKSEGFISSYHIEKKENNKVSLLVDLKYYEGMPVIREIKRVSKPGRRVYSSATSIPRIQNGLGLAIISTNKGIMSDIDARKNNIGGEIICRVF
jgi:small subunit ribosomal protein S8